MKSYIIALAALSVLVFAHADPEAKSKKISDDDLNEFVRIEKYYRGSFAAGTVSQIEVDNVERLLNRAHYLHGDISRADFLKRSDELTKEMRQFIQNEIEAGTENLKAEVPMYEAALQDKALP